MRTIKFRGKRNHSGEWHYGHYTQGSFFYPATEDETVRHLIHADMLYDVDENTVGQFTGLYDKDGKEIYEGDIILEKSKRSRKDGDLYEIVFEDCQWFGKNKDGAATSLSLLNDFSVIKIIGNIHDNPELLTNQ